MSTGIYLQIEGIKGESTDSKHKGWIELSSVDLSLCNNTTNATSGERKAGTASAYFQPIHCRKTIDQTSVHLASRIWGCRPISKVSLHLSTTQSDNQHTYAEYELEDCYICELNQNCGSNGMPQESFAITYSKIKASFTPIDEKGKPGTKVGPEGWDLTTNKKV